MATVWITYSWADNASNDVDFIAQELRAVDLEVKLDRWNVSAGGRLWDQIDSFISDPEQSDAWLIVATQNSLGSEACKEELAYALDRAISKRGGEYPLIALFVSSVDPDLIPAAIRSRLYVSIQDPGWKERVAAAAERRPHNTSQGTIEPYKIQIHKDVQKVRTHAIEVRPRAGVWAPFFAAIPIGEKDQVNMYVTQAPSGRPTGEVLLHSQFQSVEFNGEWWAMGASNRIDPNQSIYVWCSEMPTRLRFGDVSGDPVYEFEF